MYSATSSQTSLPTETKFHILPMTQADFHMGASSLTFTFEAYDTNFGRVIIASTAKGIALISFGDINADHFAEFRAKYPNAQWIQNRVSIHEKAVEIINNTIENDLDINLHMHGTAFQIRVWKTLLELPFGSVVTYSDIAKAAGHPRAVRAAASAVARNPVAVLIPCHRVIRSTGEFGQYRWSPERKAALIDFERSR
jgi:AraC family transcriptional regulator, regulatory protein of adaptative response / methylated-DNA-[protein]-cysteine methyltransferase